jgi:hypothetical protein
MGGESGRGLRVASGQTDNHDQAENNDAFIQSNLLGRVSKNHTFD